MEQFHMWTFVTRGSRRRLSMTLAFVLIVSVLTLVFTPPAHAVPGVTVTPTSGTIAEDGGIMTYDVVLDELPSADVTISIALPGTGEVSLDKSSLIFTSTDGTTLQTVTVTGVGDDIDDGDVMSTIVHTASSLDLNYDEITVDSVVVTTTDDETAGVTLTPTLGNATEGGATATYTVELDSEPMFNVTVTIDDSSPDVTADVTVLVFTPSEWNSPKTVVVTAVDDDFVEDDEFPNITHAATSGDTNYIIPVAGTFAVTVNDNDSAGVILMPTSGSVTEGGATVTYTVELSSQPTADVIVAVNESSPDISLSVTSLTFTAGNWDTPRDVIVTAVDDDLVEPVESPNVTHAATSGDTNYIIPVAGTFAVTV
ncbi:MAG: hypothetical protein IIC71_05110, partial [Acidobacteria bacterium]|nr:hypothetical protein [Acidobacteriota bacterium]